MAAAPRYSKPPGCTGCSLETAGWGFVPPTGPVHSRILFVGEAPAAEEIIAGEPFYGSAGGVLSRILVRAGLNRDHYRIVNTIACRAPNDYLVGAPWEDHAISQCQQYLQPTIDQLPVDGVIVPLGATALTTILGLRGVAGVAVKDFAGTVSRSPDQRHWVVPSFHPSHLQRGAMNLLDVVTEDIKLAEKISRTGFVRSLTRLVVDPALPWFQGWVSEHLAAVEQDPDGTWCAIDTEFEGKPEDESEAHVTGGVRLTRFNCARDTVTGISVPYQGEFIREIDRLLAGLNRLRGIALLWFKYADWVPLAAAGHQLDEIEAYDLAAVWRHIQSDLPQGLGFVAARASDFGPWKHWAKDKSRFGEYAAADGVQTFRTGVWLIKAAQQLGMWEMFVRDWHERDRYCLRPAHLMGVPIDKVELDQFHVENQAKLARVLERIKLTAAQGVLKPKLGYAKRPSHSAAAEFKKAGWAACLADKTHDTYFVDQSINGGVGAQFGCRTCGHGAGFDGDVQPPVSILGKPKAGGAEAKTQYMIEGVRLVEKLLMVECRACRTCGAEDVGAKHRCPVPKRRKAAKGTSDSGAPPDASRVAEVVLVSRERTRYFWQLPFNPDAPAQVLAYIASQGIEQPFDKKKQKATTNKQAMKKLAKDYSEDPFFQAKLDWAAVQKVDATYAVGTQRRLDKFDRVHPQYLCKPSTLRDSAVDPNLTNVVADKTGPESLAAGFRRCIVSRDGVPLGVTEQELADWETRWASTN